MNVTVRESGTGAEGSYKKFVGVSAMYVKAFNPTKAELEAMGLKPKEEPKYLIYSKDNPSKIEAVRFSFHLESKLKDQVIRATLDLYLRKEFVESKKEGEESSFNYIDKFGKNSFEKPSDISLRQPKSNWIDIQSAKKAIKGEVELVQFIRCLVNSDANDATIFSVDDFRAIFSGDFSKFRKNVIEPSQEKGNVVKVLLGVREREGKYYTYVYDRKFDRGWSNSAKYIHSSLMRNINKLPSGVTFGNISENFVESDFYIREWTEQNQTVASSSAVHQSLAGGIGLNDMIDNAEPVMAEAYSGQGEDFLPF